MKKNAMLKIAAILMVAVLLTTCAISSTFAKYVTSDTSTDSARVAKFGVTVTTNIADLFKSNYDGADPADGDDVVGIASVDGSNITYADVVAPGTAGGIDLASVITGKPEVAVEVATTAVVELGDNWVYNDGQEGSVDSYYCPLYVTVNTEELYGNDYASAGEFEAAIVAEIVKANNAKFAPNTDLGEGKKLDVAISWKWAIEAVSGDTKQTNEKDTYLGDQAAKDFAGAISITLTQSVTQLDDYTAG